MLQYNECWYGSARPSMIMPIFSSYLFTRGGYMIEVYIANSNWLLLTLSLRQGVQCQATGNWPLSIDRSIDLRVENRRWVWGKSLLQKQWYSAVCVSSGEWWPYPALLVPPTISCSSLGVGATMLHLGWGAWMLSRRATRVLDHMRTGGGLFLCVQWAVAWYLLSCQYKLLLLPDPSPFLYENFMSKKDKGYINSSAC